jgi:hypothetical protein
MIQLQMNIANIEIQSNYPFLVCIKSKGYTCGTV